MHEIDTLLFRAKMGWINFGRPVHTPVDTLVHTPACSSSETSSSYSYPQGPSPCSQPLSPAPFSQPPSPTLHSQTLAPSPYSNTPLAYSQSQTQINEETCSQMRTDHSTTAGEFLSTFQSSSGFL